MFASIVFIHPHPKCQCFLEIRQLHLRLLLCTESLTTNKSSLSNIVYVKMSNQGSHIVKDCSHVSLHLHVNFSPFSTNLVQIHCANPVCLESSSASAGARTGCYETVSHDFPPFFHQHPCTLWPFSRLGFTFLVCLFLW